MNEDIANIRGWGVDADGTVSPVRTGEATDPSTGIPPQVTEREILHSNERPYMTAVFGTTLPPAGLSGHFRRRAFRYSESNWMHWLLLLLADRINVAEGIADDLKSGQAPNILKEKGWGARWKYDRKRTLTRIAIGTGTALLTIALLGTKSGGRRKH